MPVRDTLQLRIEADGDWYYYGRMKTGCGVCQYPLMAVPVLLSVTLSLYAQKPQVTDREKDGLSGPVRSVSTTREPTQVKYQLPDGPGIPMPNSPLDSEYDQEGRRTWSGSNNSSRSRYVKDSSGAVIEQVDENEKGEPWRRLLFGPFGPIEAQVLTDSHWSTRETHRYDNRGNVVESLTFDADGSLLSRRETTFDEDGLAIEDWLHGRDNSFSWHTVHTYDRKSKFETFTSFHEDGSTDVTFVVQGSKVLSYWQSAANAGPGSLFRMETGPRTAEVRSYKPDRSFGRADYVYLEEQKRNVVRAEVYDGADELKATAEYEYEFDARGNWVKCSVKVWTPSLGTSELYETDHRTIAYW
jgi:hypothetical protein